MKANRKFVEEEEAVSAVIGVILMVAITVAIAATVYVYVTGIVPQTSSNMENAGVTVSATSGDQISVLLASPGQNYGSGYPDVKVMVNGAEADGILSLGTDSLWTAGESIIIGEGATGPEYDGAGTLSGDYDVTVTVRESVVFDGTVSVA